MKQILIQKYNETNIDNILANVLQIKRNIIIASDRKYREETGLLRIHRATNDYQKRFLTLGTSNISIHMG